MRMVTKKGIVNRFNSAQNSLVIQAADMSLETVAAMVESESIDVQPLYQRRERWNSKAQSALVESFLLNIPVPPVYLAEEDFGTYSVIDGKQRLTTIKRFMREEFGLSDLDRFSELESKKFSGLPADLQNALRIRPYLRVVTLLKQSDPELKYEVFTRLNTGGVPLQPQEVRNAMYRGKLNDLLVKLSSDKFLRKQLKIRTLREDAYKTMGDVEYVLRFFTMHASWNSFSGDYRRSMDYFMRDNRNPTPSRIQSFRNSFQTTIERCKTLWGETAFRRFDKANDSYRDQFLSALYDAQMVAAAELTASEFNALASKSNMIVRKTKALFSDPVFENAIRLSTNTPSRVRERIGKMLALLRSI